MYLLFCTSYNETEHGLVLRNNWVERCENEQHLSDIKDKWGLIEMEDNIISKGTYSNIFCGKMGFDNVVIHVRIVRF